MKNSDAHILDNLSAWQDVFQKGWLATYQSYGKIDWDQYRPPINRTVISGTSVDPAQSRLMLITSSGAFLPQSQCPFDAANPLGDYTIREMPSSIQLDDLTFAHEHYDHQAVREDPQVLVPFNHLRVLEANGTIRELTNMISFMGYQPDVSRVIQETTPAIIDQARNAQVDAVLLVPS